MFLQEVLYEKQRDGKGNGGLGTGEIICMEGTVCLLCGWAVITEVCFPWNVVALRGRR